MNLEGFYHAMQTVGAKDEYHMRIARDSDLLTHEEVAQLLNQQAETIEVLREWIRKCGQKLIADEREIIENSEFSSPEDLMESKRRIAALEGK